MGIRILIPRPRGTLAAVRTRRFLWVALGAALWGVAYTIFGVGGLVGVYRARAEVERLQAEVGAARATNDALRERIEGLRSDPLVIEGEARQRLGLVKPGETVYLLPPLPAEEAVSPPDAEARAPSDPRRP